MAADLRVPEGAEGSPDATVNTSAPAGPETGQAGPTFRPALILPVGSKGRPAWPTAALLLPAHLAAKREGLVIRAPVRRDQE